MIYVSILETLNVLLNNEAIVSEVYMMTNSITISVIIINRYKMVILIMMDSWKTIAMEKLLPVIHFFQLNQKLFKYFCITMTWRFAIR